MIGNNKIAQRHAALELMAAKYQAVDALKTLRRLEANAYSFFRESEVLQLLPAVKRPADYEKYLAHAEHQLAICRDRLDRRRYQVMRVVGELHHCVIKIAVLNIEDIDIQRQCEVVLRLSLPVCPPPATSVRSQEEVTLWLHEITVAIDEDIQAFFGIEVDRLLRLWSNESTLN